MNCADAYRSLTMACFRALCVAAMACAALQPGVALANDSVAEIGAGGLLLGRSEEIAIESETLYLSMNEVRVDYAFHNRADHDVETVVAFPMPDIDTDPYEGDWAIPENGDNFLGFTVEADGQTITPQLQQRAFAAGVDVTDAIKAAGLHLAPFDDAGEPPDFSGVPETVIEDLIARGALRGTRDADTGRYEDVRNAWTLRSAYWWRMTFPAGATIRVHHSYTPAIGGSAGLFFFENEDMKAVDANYASKYCMDASFLDAVRKRQRESMANDGYGYTEQRLSYVLTTGANWAGPIGHFRLIVDKGTTDNLVSYCGTGVTKTGPTTFELTAEDFWPERDLDILFAVAPQTE